MPSGAPGGRGLYEQLLTEALDFSLRESAGRLAPLTENLRAAEAADRFALHISRLVQRAREVPLN